MTLPASQAVRAAGDAALLVDAGAGPPVPARLAAAIAAERTPGVSDIIPGAQTVLVVTEPGRIDMSALAARLRQLARPDPPVPGPEAAGGVPAAGDAGIPRDGAAGAASGALGGAPSADVGGTPSADVVGAASTGLAGGWAVGGEVAEIPVLYDGPDLAEVAEQTGLTVDDVIARHSAAEYTAAWLGFSPGFAYLTGLDPALHVPRRSSPRTSVPAGSVAIAGPLAAVYPAASPGGWRLLGRTTARLWDPARQPPSALAPGTRVRFRAVRELATSYDIFPAGTRAETVDSGPAHRVIEVIRPGPLAIVADLGRPGYGHLGVPRSGAADPASLRLANRLVGNPEGAAGLELTLGGAALLFRTPAWAALTGAPVRVRLEQPEAGPAADDSGMGVPFAVPAGTTLTISVPATGLRSYLAVRGGIDVPPVLGSRSADRLSGLGPAPLRPGDLLPAGGTSGCGPIVADVAPLAAAEPGPAELRIVAGPRDDWFTAGARRALRSAVYTVTSDSNRSGLRLSGPPLPRGRPGELPSEGMALGALQVPPSGQPILFLADHPVTGGYPVIAVVVSADIGRAAQLRPGDSARFRFVPPAA